MSAVGRSDYSAPDVSQAIQGRYAAGSPLRPGRGPRLTDDFRSPSPSVPGLRIASPEPEVAPRRAEGPTTIFDQRAPQATTLGEAAEDYEPTAQETLLPAVPFIVAPHVLRELGRRALVPAVNAAIEAWTAEGQGEEEEEPGGEQEGPTHQATETEPASTESLAPQASELVRPDEISPEYWEVLTPEQQGQLAEFAALYPIGTFPIIHEDQLRWRRDEDEPPTVTIGSIGAPNIQRFEQGVEEERRAGDGVSLSDEGLGVWLTRGFRGRAPDRNRRVAQRGSPRAGRDLERHEYEAASTLQGGEGARILYLDRAEHSAHTADLNHGYLYGDNGGPIRPLTWFRYRYRPYRD